MVSRNENPSQTLLRCLEPSAPASCLVYLYTYFEDVGLLGIENEIRADYQHQLYLKAHQPRAGERLGDFCRRSTRHLERLRDPVAFDYFALAWLKGLDAEIGQTSWQEEFLDSTVCRIPRSPTSRTSPNTAARPTCSSSCRSKPPCLPSGCLDYSSASQV